LQKAQKIMVFNKIAVLIGVAYPACKSKVLKIVLMLTHFVKLFFVIVFGVQVYANFTQFKKEPKSYMVEFYRNSETLTAFSTLFYACKLATKEHQIFRNDQKMTFWQITLSTLQIPLLMLTFIFEKEGFLYFMIMQDVTIKVTCIRFILAINVIKNKLKSINKRIKALIMSHEDFKVFSFECKYFTVNHSHKDIEFELEMAQLMKIHSDTCELVALVNGTFGLRMLFVLITFFNSILHFSYIFFVEIETTQNCEEIVGELKVEI
jgi:hypothetical protein